MIHIYNTNEIIKILIQTEIKRIEIKTIQETLEQNKVFEISLIDIEFVVSDIIKLFIKYKNNLTLNTNNHTLWLYLRNLNIDIKLNYHNKKSILHNVPIKAIGIGGSAGSLSNIMNIIQKLPYCDISVFIVIHILPNEKSKLVEILQQFTNYTVKEPVHNEQMQLKHIYIASPDLHMYVEGGHIYHSNTPKVNFCRPAIDVLFKSLAIEYKNSLLVILTCGYLDDGSRSLKDIKNYGGISIIQDPNQCEANEMPINAMITKNYDLVFSLDDINSFIKDKLNFTLNLEDRINSLVEGIDKKYGYNFKQYDKSSLTRRIEILRQELAIESFSEFEYMVLNDSEIFELLFKKISINVSEFFRDADMFFEFEKHIIPILATYPHIRIWCSASAKGQEAYSIAMILDKFGLLKRSVIYATDFNALIIEQAKNGLFTKKEFEKCSSNYSLLGNKSDLSRWFNIYDGFVEVKEPIKNKVQFFQHNLVTDGEFNEFHIIFCRNVLIYFDEKLQDKVIDLMHSSLIRNGFLILGSSEHINNKDKFTQLLGGKYNKIFKKAKEYR